MKRLVGTIGSILLLFSALNNAFAAQGSTAQISGVVRDQTGAVLPGAEVTTTQTATGAKRTVLTNESGSFTLPSLPVGPYMLEVALPGFRAYVQTGIVLQVDSNPVINPVLAVGQVTEQVEVQADAALLETHSTGVGTVVDNQRVVELPLNGRNATELIFLAGMATTGNGGGALNTVRNYPTVLISVAGGQGNGMTYLLDGANHNDTNNNLNLPLPFPDALQEFKVETSALPAQYGLHSAAAVNAVTKSGTNEFHGDLFEFVRNGSFNARDFFATKRDTLKRNQFGGVIGGPILKNKLFFFGGYQRTSQRSDPNQSIGYVPTAAMLAGDFTAVASPACNGGRQLTLAAAQGFVGNQISPAAFNPVALKIASLLPLSADPCGRINYGLVSNLDEHTAVGRVDYQHSDKHSIFGRVNINDMDLPTTFDGVNPLSINQASSHYRVYVLALGDTHLVGTGTVSSFRASANRTEIPKNADGYYSFTDLGVQNFTPLAGKSFKMSVTGNGFAIGGGSSTPSRAYTGPNVQVAEDVSSIRGTHQLGFGANYIYQLMNYSSGVNATGNFTFNGSVSNLGLADFLMGNASSFNQGNIYGFYNRQNYVGLYAQDAWKMTSRVTVNYGIRFEPYIAPYSKYGQFDHFDPALFAQNVHSSVYVNAPAGEIFPGDSQYTAGNAPHQSRYNKFVPRIGVVWDPEGNSRMVVRASYGMFTDRQHAFANIGFAQGAPFGNNVSLSNVNLANPWGAYPGGNPFPRSLSKDVVFPIFGAYTTNNLNFKPTYLHQWNLTVERQIGTNWLMAVTYLGNSTIHMVTANNLNPAVFLGLGPCTINGASYQTCSTTANQNQRRVLYLQNPSQGQYYGSVNTLDDGGTGSYNALFASVQKRLSRGVSVLANYTWSHCISDVWDGQVGNGGSSLITPNNRRADRSNCATSDVRQNFNLSAVLQTRKFSTGILRILASDWQISPIVKLRSAQFFTVTTGVDNALTGQGGQRPNLVPGVSPYAANKSINQWLNPAAFASPAPGTYGNLGNNNLKGPGTFQLDMAVSRTFPIGEKKTLQLRGEAFNVPNHLNPSTPVATLNSGAFGKIQSDIQGVQTGGLFTGGGDPRIIQLALKLVF